MLLKKNLLFNVNNLSTTEIKQITSPNNYYELKIIKIGKIVIFHVYDLNNLPPLVPEIITIPYVVENAVGTAVGNDGTVGICLIENNQFTVISKKGITHSWYGAVVTILKN